MIFLLLPFALIGLVMLFVAGVRTYREMQRLKLEAIAKAIARKRLRLVPPEALHAPVEAPALPPPPSECSDIKVVRTGPTLAWERCNDIGCEICARYCSRPQ